MDNRVIIEFIIFNFDNSFCIFLCVFVYFVFLFIGEYSVIWIKYGNKGWILLFFNCESLLILMEWMVWKVWVVGVLDSIIFVNLIVLSDSLFYESCCEWINFF